MSICNLEYKAKERKFKLRQQRWFHANLACSHVRHGCSPQSCNKNDTPSQSRIGTGRKSTGEKAFTTTKQRFSQICADVLRSCGNEENDEGSIVSNSSLEVAERPYIVQL